MASLDALRKKVSEIKKVIGFGKEIHIKVDGYSFEIYAKNKTIKYIPSSTGIKFHSSNALVKGLMGPVGSGKTTINVADMVLEAVNMPACADGVRRYRGVIIRNTYSELQTTSLKTWMDWFGELGNAKVKESSPIRYRAIFNDEKGGIDMEVYFLSMDREDNVKKMDSLEVTRIFLNEIRHLPMLVIGRSQQRISRYPGRDKIGPYRGCVSFDTNPPNLKSEFYRIFEQERPDMYELIKQPPGLLKTEKGYIENSSADNLNNLTPGYYTNNAEGQSEEHIRVMLLGEYGISENAKRIYHEYNDDIHSVDKLEYLEGRTVYIGIDYETLPSATFCQVTQNGRILLIKEIMAEKSGFRSFCENLLTPYVNSFLRGYEFVVTDDPAGNAQQPTDEKTCRMVLQEFGLNASPAYSNFFGPRTEAVRNILNLMIDGKSAFSLSREGCPMIREGFMGGYHYKTIATADGVESTGKAEKNKFADIHDALQYNIMGIKGAPQPKTTYKPKLRPKGVFI